MVDTDLNLHPIGCYQVVSMKEAKASQLSNMHFSSVAL
jgi:hypothetical protein